DVLVDMSSRYLRRVAVAILILEHIEARQFHRVANDASYLSILQLALLSHAGLSREVKLNQLALHVDVFTSKGSDPVAAVLIRIHFASRPHVTRRQNAQYRS